MPRKYTPKPGGKTYKKYNEQIIKKALNDFKLRSSTNKTPSIAFVAHKHGIPVSVLHRHKMRKMKSHGGQTALTPESEEHILHILNMFSELGYALDKLDLRYIVKIYLDSAKIIIKRFRNNFPGPDYADNFLRRHSSKILKLSTNLPTSRATKTAGETDSHMNNELLVHQLKEMRYGTKNFHKSKINKDVKDSIGNDSELSTTKEINLYSQDKQIEFVDSEDSTNKGIEKKTWYHVQQSIINHLTPILFNNSPKVQQSATELLPEFIDVMPVVLEEEIQFIAEEEVHDI